MSRRFHPIVEIWFLLQSSYLLFDASAVFSPTDIGSLLLKCNMRVRQISQTKTSMIGESLKLVLRTEILIRPALIVRVRTGGNLWRSRKQCRFCGMFWLNVRVLFWRAVFCWCPLHLKRWRIMAALRCI